MSTPKQPKKSTQKTTKSSGLRRLNPNTAGIDIGATMHYVAVPPERAETPVRCFGTHTADLHRIVAWLKQSRITSVAMESTGSYWIALYQVLERSRSLPDRGYGYSFSCRMDRFEALGSEDRSGRYFGGV